ncbi:uncharacterized protein BDV17DRAFT_273437 [Aspergillus undulatus]|uniref:uncharacterized protein n=1 Tax=Aspergillus undulatus TaxID=1810928 RepID=UPI003CCD4B5D
MLRHRTRIPRISRPVAPLLRQHLVPNSTRPSCRRPFTHKPPFQMHPPQRSRPQVSYLSPPPISRALPPWSIHLKQHFARLIFTESRRHFRKRMSNFLRVWLSVGGIIIFFELIKVGIYQATLEHKWPSPPEWTWKSRWCGRSLEAWQRPEEIGRLITDWPMVAGYCKELLMRLEDSEIDGKDLVELEEGGIFIEGVGKSGYDITAKSEPWRRGYFRALLGAAKAAENLEGWWTDRKQRVSAPKEYFVGPSNPRPKPVKKPPREEDSEPASPSPEVFYMKILTTRGFDEGQKVEAALAYADWLDYKGLQSTAADMYTWAMDIATSGSPEDAFKVVDLKTGVLRNDPQVPPSANIIRVSTALAVHHARHENLPTALSIFTSVLKARRALLPEPSDTPTWAIPSFVKPSADFFVSLINKIRTVTTSVEYPPPPPSGNEPPYRTASSPCDEAGLMTYIGEIIYASHSKEQGLAWTRDAVDLAEYTLPETDTSAADNKCTECLRVSLGNWKTMVSQFLKKAQAEEEEVLEKAKDSSWLSGPSKKTVEKKSNERKRWEAEQFILDDRIKRLQPIIMMEAAIQGDIPGIGLF